MTLTSEKRTLPGVHVLTNMTENRRRTFLLVECFSMKSLCKQSKDNHCFFYFSYFFIKKIKGIRLYLQD